MSDTTSQAPPAPAASPAPATPSPGTQPAPAPAARPSATNFGVSQDTADAFADFGPARPLRRDGPAAKAPASAPAPAPKVGDPGQSEQEPPASADKDAPAQPGKPAAETTGFADLDEVLRELTPSTAAKPAQPGLDAPFEVLDSPEKIEAAINPDGQATAEQRLTKLLPLLGRHATEVGNARKEVQAAQSVRDEAQRITQTLGEFFKFGQDGKLADAALDKVVEAIGADRAQAALARAGLRLVRDGEAGSQGGPRDARALKLDAANAMMPGQELTPEEKLQVIEADPDQRDELMLRVQDMRASEREKLTTDAQTRRRTVDAQNQQSGEFLRGLAAKHGAEFEAKWMPALQAEADAIPLDVLPPGPHRLRVLYDMARLKMIVRDMPARLKAARAQAEGDAAKKLGLGGAAPDGGEATYPEAAARRDGAGAAVSDATFDAFAKDFRGGH